VRIDRLSPAGERSSKFVVGGNALFEVGAQLAAHGRTIHLGQEATSAGYSEDLERQRMSGQSFAAEIDLANNLDVMREEARKWDWVALMIDVDPEDLKYGICDFPALFYVDPDDYRPGNRAARQEWLLRIQGKHRNRDAARAALDDMITSRY
jgi:hypothetical protein